jgi:hypothetical protein
MLENQVVSDLLRNRIVYYNAFSDKLGGVVTEILMRSPLFTLPEHSGDVFIQREHVFTPDGAKLALPLTNFCVAITFSDGNTVLYAFAQGENGVYVFSFSKTANKWGAYPPYLLKPGGADLLFGYDARYLKGFKPPGRAAEYLEKDAQEAMRLFGYINMTGTRKVAVLKTSGMSVQQVAKSKKPLWEYHELALSASTTGGDPKGGTHASPRWHTRRGHWRNYKSGKRVWVAQMEVGDKSLGVVVKDYVLTS